MIQLLVALAGFFSWWMLWLIVASPTSVVLIVLGCGAYLVYFGFMTKNPIHSLYGFVVISLFFPKGGNDFGPVQVRELAGGVVALFAIVQLTAAMTVGVRVMMISRRATTMSLRVVGLACTIGVALAFVIAGARTLLVVPVTVSSGPEFLVWSTPVLTATLFLIGCSRMITRREEIERILTILIVFGAVLLLEWFLYGFMGLDLPRADWVFHRSGRFMSFFLNDSTLVGIMSVIALVAAIYFAQKRGSLWLWTLGVGILVPTVFTLQRAPLVAAALAAGLMIAVHLNWRHAVIASTAVLILISLTIIDFRRTTDAVEDFYTIQRLGKVSPLAASAQSRVGSYLRGVDVIIESFPLGVGPGLVQEWMVSPDVARHFDLSRSWTPSRDFYLQISSGQHRTSPHNAFLTNVIEYGLLGAIVISTIVFATLNAYRRRLLSRGRAHDALQTAGFAGLLGLLVIGMAVDLVVYWLVFLFFYLVVRSPFASDPRLANPVGGGGGECDEPVAPHFFLTGWSRSPRLD